VRTFLMVGASFWMVGASFCEVGATFWVFGANFREVGMIFWKFGCDLLGSRCGIWIQDPGPKIQGYRLSALHRYR